MDSGSLAWLSNDRCAGKDENEVNLTHSQREVVGILSKRCTGNAHLWCLQLELRRMSLHTKSLKRNLEVGDGA